MQLLGLSSPVFCYGKIEGYPHSDACFEKVEKGKIKERLDRISELISNTDKPVI